MVDLSRLIQERESEWVDFKREFHSNNAELLHDILCLSNAFYDGNRFIVFGVANNKTVYGVENDTNKKTNADLHDFLRQIFLNSIPQIELTSHGLEGHEIGLLTITNSPSKPHFILRDYQYRGITIRAGVVYTRLSDTNIPRGETAPEDHIELMWMERFGLLKDIKSLEFDNDIKE